jgi:Gpi18-like mannosyltransferase
MLKGRIPWLYFFVVPLIYLVFGSAAAVIGRSWESIISLYVGQVDQFEYLAMYVPNLYSFIPNIYYQPALKMGLLIFFAVMLCWAYLSWRSKMILTPYRILFLALASVAIVPFLLPKMHDRYFYPADVFSFVVAVFNPELWFLPVLYQGISGLSYTSFLFQWSTDYVKIAAVLNTITLGYLLKKYISIFGDNHVNA